ncbi:MAG: hypothetical protein ACRBFS_07025 [Aureispira sp.]
MEPLVEHLAPTARDTLGRATYFADFTKDVGKGYIGNNFGQDLRNFQRYLHYVQKKVLLVFGFLLGNPCCFCYSTASFINLSTLL